MNSYIVPNWPILSINEKQELLEKSLTITEKWLTVRSSSPYDLVRHILLKHIVETEFINVKATNVLEYWINYSKNIQGFDSSDNRWIKILWLDIIYLLVANHYSQGLHPLVRQIMITHYVNTLEV